MYIVTAKEMYDADHYTMEKIGLDGKLLMENAGREVSRKIAEVTDHSRKILVVAGAGNNGGDGFVIARTLLNQAYDVQVIQVASNRKLTKDTQFHKKLYIHCGGSVMMAEETAVKPFIEQADIIIDAMIGIGVNGVLREPFAKIAAIINESCGYIIAVDIPSGLPADEGITDFRSVRADYTIIIGALKSSVFLQQTAPFYGRWEMVSIGFPPAAFDTYTNKQAMTAKEFRQSMPQRYPYDHKGTHGKGLAVGGSAEMPGSLIMAVQASLKSGAGLITAGASSSVISMIASQCIEATFLTIPEKDGLLTNDRPVQMENYHGIALGMGMGRNKETGALVRDILTRAMVPVVIDADGLYHVKDDLTILKSRENSPTILTPHPGEMAMLLDISIPELLKAPFQHAYNFATQHQVYVVLKGTYTIITAPDGKQAVSTAGNAGLAKGGSGDVLTGIILAMVMQEQSIFQALSNACFVHGKSAELLTADSHSYHDLLASDVIRGISNVYRTFL